MNLAIATTGFTTGAGLIIAIGAQNAFVLREGLNRSYAGLVVGICALSDMLLIVLGVTGVGIVVEQWPELIQVLRFGGAAFLAVYGLLAARRAWRGTSALSANAQVSSSPVKVVLACLAFTFLNPHVYLDTVVLLGSIAAQYPDAEKWTFAMGACLASIVWFTSLGYGARLTQGLFSKPAAWRILDASIAFFMLVLGLKLVIDPIA